MQDNALEVTVDIQIRNYRGGSNFGLRETVHIPNANFMQIAGLMEGFHKVAESLKELSANEPQ